MLTLTMVPFAAAPLSLVFLGRSAEQIRLWFWLLTALLFVYVIGAILVIGYLSAVLFPMMFLFSVMLCAVASADRRAKVARQRKL